MKPICKNCKTELFDSEIAGIYQFCSPLCEIEYNQENGECEEGLHTEYAGDTCPKCKKELNKQ